MIITEAFLLIGDFRKTFVIWYENSLVA